MKEETEETDNRKEFEEAIEEAIEEAKEELIKK
jgi:ribosomal protein S5